MRWQLAALITMPVLFAQQPLAQDRESALEEVLVTAQHRTETAISTPISLFTMNAEQLEKQRIDSIADLNGLVPNLAIDNFPANNQTLRLFIRGVGLTDTQITQDPAVGVYLNGAYIARSAGLTFDVADIERIEVLRGPQGTLYGRNTTGGAIKLITKKPDLENLTFDQTLGTGNQGLFRSKTSVNVPFADKYAAKLAYFYEDVDGFTNNDGPGGGFGDRKSKGFRLDLRADLSDNLSLDYGFDDSRIKYYNYTAQAVTPRLPGSSLLSVIGVIAEQYIDYGSNRFSDLATSVPLLPTDIHIKGHTLNADWTVNDAMSLRSITAWRELHDKTYTDFSSGSTEGFRIDFNSAVLGANAGDEQQNLPATRPNLKQEQFSQEFQLLGNLNNSIEYLAGIYYFWEKGDENAEPLHHIFSAFPFGGGTIYNLSAERNQIENDALAFFTQLTWTPNILEQRLHLTLGGRISRDSREADRQVTDWTVIDQDTSVFSLVGPDEFNANPDKDFDDTSFTFIAQYDLRENINVYGKYAGAYKSGGFNTRDPEEAGFNDGFDEEKLNAFEIGLKGEALDRRLRFSTAIFYQKFDDFQYNFQIPGTISGTRVFNLDNGEMSGIELELMAMPVTGLLLQLSYAYLDSELDDVANPFFNPDDPNTNETIEGNFGNAPKNSFSFVTGYTFPTTSIGVVNANASYSFVDDRNPDAEFTYRDSYDLINARVSLSEVSGLGGQWEFALWGKNLADNDYEAFALDNLPQASRAVIWGDGRSYGLDVTYRFF
jgi:iron complex outermembrane receptor protein